MNSISSTESPGIRGGGIHHDDLAVFCVFLVCFFWFVLKLFFFFEINK